MPHDVFLKIETVPGERSAPSGGQIMCDGSVRLADASNSFANCLKDASNSFANNDGTSEPTRSGPTSIDDDDMSGGELGLYRRNWGVKDQQASL
jgi:hypothetical protein